MRNILSQLPFTFSWIIRYHLANSKTILDIGCGDGALMSKVNSDKKYEVVGVDLYKPYLEKAKKSGVYKRLISLDLRKLKFRNKSFDIVLASQVIEHLSKKEARALIVKLEEIARNKVIIATPNGFVKYDPFEVIDNNKLQEHKSGWKVEEMRKLGYKVRGQANKLIYLPSTGLIYRYRKLKYLLILISYLLSPISYFLPNTCSCIIAVKDKCL